MASGCDAESSDHVTFRCKYCSVWVCVCVCICLCVCVRVSFMPMKVLTRVHDGRTHAAAYASTDMGAWNHRDKCWQSGASTDMKG
eukprot:3941082-Rhodomonas_salina.2